MVEISGSVAVGLGEIENSDMGAPRPPRTRRVEKGVVFEIAVTHAKRKLSAIFNLAYIQNEQDYQIG